MHDTDGQEMINEEHRTITVGEGFVRLDGCMADDISVVNSAKVSFAKKTDLVDGHAIGLINFLMRERHGTPFEHNSFRFHVKCPVFVAREWFRHRVGSFNEFSARYSEVQNEFFVPAVDSIRKQVGKPGAYTFDPVEERVAKESVSAIEEANKISFGTYGHLLEMGVAKEVARMVLPVSMFTQFYWTVNARSMMNFLSLRNHSSAQREIREYAIAVESIFGQVMPFSYEAWVNNDRVAP
jgi:thymidylate synthase (FAD)